MESQELVWNQISLTRFMHSFFDADTLLNWAQSEGLELRTEVQERLNLIQSGKVGCFTHFLDSISNVCVECSGEGHSWVLSQTFSSDWVEYTTSLVICKKDGFGVFICFRGNTTKCSIY